MAQKTEGIQQLLIAEKKATEKVIEARKRKALRLKTAKKEAEADIIKYRESRERAFKDAEQAAAGRYGDTETKIAVMTKKTIGEHDQNMKTKTSAAMVSIKQLLYEIQLCVHENAKL